jgi:hypothetical protein
MSVIVRSGNYISISGIAADLTPQDIFGTDGAHPEGKKIRRIEFYSNTAGDKAVVQEGSITGPVITTLDVTAEKLTDRTYFDNYMFPFIDFSAGVYTGTHALTFELE